MSLQQQKPVTSRDILRECSIGFLLGTYLVCFGALIIYLADGIEWIEARIAPGDIFLGLVIMILVAAAEEFIFRGLILRRLLHTVNRWLALIISSALFAVVHLANTDITALGIVNVFLGGMVFGISYMHTRSLPLIIFFHFSWNFFQGPILGFPVSGLPFESLFRLEVNSPSLLNGGNFGFEGSIVCTMLLLLTFIGGYWLYHQKHRKRPVAAG